MRRVVDLGRGGAGKTVCACRLGADLDVPAIELDALFWRRPDLLPLRATEWRRVQGEVGRRPCGVAGGDPGPMSTCQLRVSWVP